MTTQTNIHGIDEAIAAAIRHDTYRLRGDISVTGLIRPPQMAYLEHAHTDEITEDVSDGIWRLLGSAVHVVLERAKLTNALQEEPLGVGMGGWEVTGTPDLWREPADLLDYKVTSVWSFLLGDKPEWEQQLNAYAWLYRCCDFPVERLTIAAILRDWQKSRTHEENYPPIPFMEVHPNLWAPEQAEEWLSQRVRIHQKAREGDYPPCTSEERWARPDTWAVMKKGNVRATRVFDAEENAMAACAVSRLEGKAKDWLYMEHRPGKNVRCDDYCTVSMWCDQHQKGAK